MRSNGRVARGPRGESIPSRRLAGPLADELEEQILDNALAFGTKMPTEPELMQRYGVSRTVVREAARILAERGLVDIRPRRGMTVISKASEALTRQLATLLRTAPTGPDDLFELRELVEPAIARRAAARRTDDDLAALRASLELMEGELDDVGEYLQADMAFHEALARATHNDVYLVVTLPAAVVLRDTWRARPGEWLSYREDTSGEHQAIYDAIEARDEDAADAATRTHLARVRERVRDLLSR